MSTLARGVPTIGSPPRFPRLFEPLTIGRVTLPNRIVMLPAGPSWAFDGSVPDHDIAYFEARARGGAGLIVLGGTTVHETSQLRSRPLREAYRREHMRSFAKLADTVHRHGTRIVGQLVHLGRESIGEADQPMWAPSALRSPRTSQTPHAMTGAEIEELVESFAVSALNLRDAGFDGVELHAAHGYLIAQFFSPSANRRDDEWGGSLPNRTRFAERIIEAIRERCGSDFVLGARISGLEELDDGLGLPAGVAIAERLAAVAGVDYLSVAIGTRSAYVKDMAVPNGIAVPLARAVRDATGVPVVASQRITHPTLAERVLEAGDADLIGMARALIADPDWPSWARRGQLERIVPCVGLAQDCRQYNGAGGVSCAHNPGAGRERELGSVPPRAARQRRIVVVGGGPAGLEVARIAAGRGHEVVLFEREQRLGGQVAVAALAPHRAEIEGVVTFRADELDRLGVRVHLGVAADKDRIRAEAPDAVVLATGARLEPPDIEIHPDANVLGVAELLRRGAAALTGIRRAVVVDDGNGFWDTYSAAEHLAAHGVQVTLVTGGGQVARGIPFESAPPLLTRLRGAGVQLRVFAALAAIEADAATVYDPYELAATHSLRESTLPADLVVLVGPTVGDDGLAGELADHVEEVHLVGDCVAPRRLTHAVLEGQRLARRL
jgi:2,4-dienoyl-CoA reductase (NADPH2)